jgi:SRSO17 transposase
MDDGEVDRLRADLDEFVGEVFGSLTRAGWRERAGWYLRGLMLDGARKSVRPMAGRLGGVDGQALNHFLTDSPWSTVGVLQRLAVRLNQVIGPVAWAFDDTGFCKCGNASPGVARQYTGTAGKVTNCQVAVSMSLVTDAASCPVNWRLFLPPSWDGPDTAARRRRAGIPAGVGHREKWRLGLDMLDEAAGWGLRCPLVVADAGYGDVAQFRQALDERGLAWVVGVAHTHTAYPAEAARSAPAYSGAGRRPALRYREPAATLKDLVAAAGRAQARQVAWRDGSRIRAGKPAKLRSTFVFLRIRPAGRVHRRAYRDQDLPPRWLIAEWPPGQPEPTRYWLSNLPETTSHRKLVGLAKLRWRIEQDYRELKNELGLDHFEGRTWQGWHHHTALVSAAHGFLTCQRLHPKEPPDPLSNVSCENSKPRWSG